MDIFDFITSQCHIHANSINAKGMKAYMKGQFDYFGINAPLRKEIVKDIRKKYRLQYDETIWVLIDLLWNSDQREMQYIALDLLVPFAKKMTCKCLPILEQMIITKSWWDTVDNIAPNIVGVIFKNDHNCRNLYVAKWTESDNIWLQRSAILFQLKYRLETDQNLLMETILKQENSKSFFVRKAQGWALRQYSNFNPNFVSAFIEANPELSGLTKREAMRLIKM
ncbi:MAG: DNA alkylation repair protein [Saprospiraceae bacterium]|nr:DNA alkylation repair protein [Saprospiraceae bacterium]